MACQKTNKTCNCDFNIKSFGLCDPKRIVINGEDRTVLNWSEISVPEILCVPEAKPDIENLDQIYATADLTSIRLIETPFAYKTIEVLATASQVATVGTINGFITTLTAAVNTLFVGPGGLVFLALEAIDLVGDIPAYVTTAIEDLNSAIFELTEYIGGVVLTGNVLASYLCIVSQTLSSLLAILQTALENLILALITAADALEDPAAALTPIHDAVDLAVAAINLLISNSPVTTASIAGILNALTTLIDSLDPISYITISNNEEGTCLTGRKLIIEGFLNQKVVYTGNVDVQSVHSAHYSVPFSAFVIPYAKFQNYDYVTRVVNTLDEDGNPVQITVSGIPISCNEEIPELIPDLCEEFCVEAYIEDVFATALDPRTIFKNVTLFFLAKPSGC